MRHSISIATMILVGTMLTGCGGGSDSDAGTPVVGGDDSGSSGDAGSAISVSVGASDEITDGETTETYSQEFTVQVVDSKGYPVQGATVTPTLSLPYFAVGYWTAGSSAWTRTLTDNPCTNEDLNGNNSLDAGEDTNNNGQLDPRAADASVSWIDTQKTDANGQVKLRIQYLQSSAGWVYYGLKVTAKVSTTEGSATFSDWLGVPADQLTDVSTALPFQYSPYGTGACVTSSTAAASSGV